MTSRRLVFAAALFLVMAPSIPAVAQRPPRTLLALLAHADDETAASPVLAAVRARGARIHMIIATDGSGGSGAQATLQRYGEWAGRRRAGESPSEEARCSAQALGAQPPVLLAFSRRQDRRLFV
jgi:LmbE family N-acetylglucosaminyl deacetylase